MAVILNSILVQRSGVTSNYVIPPKAFLNSILIAGISPYNFLSVKDDSGNPVNGADVELRDGNNILRINTTTDINGYAYGYIDSNFTGPFVLNVEKLTDSTRLVFPATDDNAWDRNGKLNLVISLNPGQGAISNYATSLTTADLNAIAANTVGFTPQDLADIEQTIIDNVGDGFTPQDLADIEQTIIDNVGDGFTPQDLADITQAIIDNSEGFEQQDLDDIIQAINDNSGFDQTDLNNLTASVWNALRTDYMVAGSTGEALSVALGLMQNNYRMSDYVFDTGGRLTECKISIYRTKQDTIDQTNPITTFTMAAQFAGQNITSYMVTNDNQ